MKRSEPPSSSSSSSRALLPSFFLACLPACLPARLPKCSESDGGDEPGERWSRSRSVASCLLLLRRRLARSAVAPAFPRSVGRSVASPLCKKEREFIRSEQSRSVATREGPEPEKGREGKTRDLSVSILSVPASVVRYRDHRDEVGHHRPRRMLRGSRR